MDKTEAISVSKSAMNATGKQQAGRKLPREIPSSKATDVSQLRCHQAHLQGLERINGTDYSSSEEESMAEVEDDYNDESSSSCEVPLIDRLDRIQTKPGLRSEGSKLDANLPRSTFTMSSRRDGVAMVRSEENASEASFRPCCPYISKTESGCGKKKESNFPTVSTIGSTDPGFHEPRALPRFQDPKMCMWTSSHAANAPSEDRSCSLVNMLMRPLVNDGNMKKEADNHTLIRLSLWSVIDGHGGGCVATYASEVLLPHVAASIARALTTEIVDRGVCTVNGELRDANALDLDGLIRTSDQSRSNAHSIHYHAPCDVISEADDTPEDPVAVSEDDTIAQADPDRGASSVQAVASTASPMIHSNGPTRLDSSTKTSVHTATSHPHAEAPLGTHGPGEVAVITRAISESFLAVDEGWINSIDPVATHQTSCQSNGRWNAGACALVVMTIQRLEWTSTSAQERKVGLGGQDARDDTSHNKDAARRRMLDYAANAKSASSMSTVSSTSSMLTEADPNALSANESEITETEDDGEESDVAPSRSKTKARQITEVSSMPGRTVITTPGGCDCHVYRPHEAMLYTAHVGDCRAVLLGHAPPRTIKVGPVGGTHSDHPDTTDDESSYHSSDETECLSSSDHDAESSDEEEPGFGPKAATAKTPSYLKYVRHPARRQSRRVRDAGSHAPFVALPPLPMAPYLSSDESESELKSLALPVKPVRVSGGHDSDDNSNESSLLSPHGRDMSPPLHLAPFTRPIDLTTDHSAYNPVEVSAVLRRSNNAPRAISAGVGGGIKRVAGSLAVTRALGDAYLKTPMLSFNPYKEHAPYITARPEVNCRLLTKDGDGVLILATDGVWERCSGEDLLRWVRNYSAERIAEVERKANRRRGSQSHGDESSIASTACDEHEQSVGHKRGRLSPVVAGAAKKRKIIPGEPIRGSRRESGTASKGPGPVSTVADVIVRRVLNKVRRARNMSSLHALMSLPKGRARRSKHDDITASVIDLSAFVS